VSGTTGTAPHTLFTSLRNDSGIFCKTDKTIRNTTNMLSPSRATYENGSIDGYFLAFDTETFF